MKAVKPFLKFTLVSLCSAGLDVGAFTLLSTFFFSSSATGILTSTILSRVFSGVFNFFFNKVWVFQQNKNIVPQTKKYLILFFTQMTLSWLLVTAFSYLPLPLALVKIIVDGGLFLVSYGVQQRFIFF